MSHAYCKLCERRVDDDDVIRYSLDAYADLGWDFDEFCPYCGEEIIRIADEAIMQ